MLYDAVFCAVGILQFRKSVQNTGGFTHFVSPLPRTRWSRARRWRLWCESLWWFQAGSWKSPGLKWLEEDAAQELGPGHKLRHNMAQPSRWVYSLWSMMPIHQPWFCQLAFWCLLCQQWLKDSGGSDTIPTTHLLTILNLSNPRGRIQMFFFPLLTISKQPWDTWLWYGRGARSDTPTYVVVSDMSTSASLRIDSWKAAYEWGAIMCYPCLPTAFLHFLPMHFCRSLQKNSRGEQFYLSTAVDLTDEARERGFDMEQHRSRSLGRWYP